MRRTSKRLHWFPSAFQFQAKGPSQNDMIVMRLFSSNFDTFREAIEKKAGSSSSRTVILCCGYFKGGSIFYLRSKLQSTQLVRRPINLRMIVLLSN